MFPQRKYHYTLQFTFPKSWKSAGKHTVDLSRREMKQKVRNGGQRGRAESPRKRRLLHCVVRREWANTCAHLAQNSHVCGYLHSLEGQVIPAYVDVKLHTCYTNCIQADGFAIGMVFFGHNSAFFLPKTWQVKYLTRSSTISHTIWHSPNHLLFNLSTGAYQCSCMSSLF